MLETFCAAASVKAMLEEPGAPDILIKATEILRRCCAPFAEGQFHTETSMLHTNTESIEHVSHNPANILKIPISDVLRHTLETASTCLHTKDCITEYKRLNIAGLQYCSRNVSARDSRVFFKDTSEVLVPGVIEHIFSIEKDENRIYYVAVRRNLPAPTGQVDLFLAYRDFSTQLWNCTYDKQLDIVPVSGSRICHAISMPWGTSVLVLKPMNRVSFRSIHKLYCSTDLPVGLCGTMIIQREYWRGPLPRGAV